MNPSAPRFLSVGMHEPNIQVQPIFPLSLWMNGNWVDKVSCALAISEGLTSVMPDRA